MMAIRMSGMFVPPIVKSEDLARVRPRHGRRHPHRHVGEQEAAEDEGVAEEEDPHHGLPPGDVLERALVRGPVGDNALPAGRPRGRLLRCLSAQLVPCALTRLPDPTDCQQNVQIRSPENSRPKRTSQTSKQEVPVDGAQLDAQAHLGHVNAAPHLGSRSCPKATRPPNRCSPCSPVIR